MKWSISLLIALLFAMPAHAEDWPCWRGPRLDGSSLEKNLPLKWSVVKDKKTGAVTMENIAWQTEIPGIGHSSPIVHGDRVFLTTCLLKEEKRMLLCLDRKDGKILWEREVDVFAAGAQAQAQQLFQFDAGDRWEMCLYEFSAYT